MLRRFNLFTVLIVITALSFAFKLANVVESYRHGQNTAGTGAIAPAQAVSESDEKPPPMPKTSPLAPHGSDAEKKKAKKGQETEVNTLDNAAHRKRGLPAFPSHSYTDSEIEVLQALAERREELKKREEAVHMKEALLEAAEKEVDRKIEELKTLRVQLENLLGKQEEVQEQRLRQIVKIYESMKPKEAARIFDTLEMGVLLNVLGRMSERKSAPILADMNPEKARQVTIRLSEQRKLPSLPDDKKK